MTYDVSKLSDDQLLQINIRTADNLRARLLTLEGSYQSFSQNYSDEAITLYQNYIPFANAVDMMHANNEFERLDSRGLREMAKLSLEVSKAYRLNVYTPDDQKEYDNTIERFKTDVYREAIKRLNENKEELRVYRNTLIGELGNKEGPNLKPVYEYFNLLAEFRENKAILDRTCRGRQGNFDRLLLRNNNIKTEMTNLEKNFPLVRFLKNYEYNNYKDTLHKGIIDLCDKISEAQAKVQKLLDKKKYPIWELNPIIASIFANDEYYTDDRQEYVYDWVCEQERMDQLFNIFVNAIPIAIATLAFFATGGLSLLVIFASASAGGAITVKDFIKAKDTTDKVYSQFHVSDDARKVLTSANLSQAEFEYGMALFNGALTIVDFIGVISVARKLGIGDKALKLLSKGKATKEELDELVKAAESFQKAFKNVPKSNGTWTGSRGNSMWIPEKKYIPKQWNDTNQTWETILKKYNIEGVVYKNGYPDFSIISKGDVKIKNFSVQRYAKGGNFEQADKALAKIRTERGKPCTYKDVRAWRESHNYTWHETQDCMTMQKVPLEVHQNMWHKGGIAKQKEIEKQLIEERFDD